MANDRISGSSVSRSLEADVYLGAGGKGTRVPTFGMLVKSEAGDRSSITTGFSDMRLPIIAQIAIDMQIAVGNLGFCEDASL